MAVQSVGLEEFMKLSLEYQILDVRSEGEFEHAHYPGAISFPLFNNEERKVVGTAYKQESREKAIKIGLEYFGKKMVSMVEQVEAIANTEKLKEPGHKPTFLIHCWRGGMRSAGVAWLLDLYGFKVYTLRGGYKSFRQWVISNWEIPYPLQILGGYTGSGKTHVLQSLQDNGDIIVDLEGLANHKGSAFGDMGKQPSQEMFENKLALAMKQASFYANEKGKPIWLEDESQRIGQVNIPMPFWLHMRSCLLIFLQINFEERLEHIISDYGTIDKEKIEASILRIQKRLGGLETKNAIKFLHENDLKGCFRILLAYYDKHYHKAFINRGETGNPIIKQDFEKVDPIKIALVISQKTQISV